MSLADAGKVEEAQREFLFIRRGGRAARASVAKEKQSVEQDQQVVQGTQVVAQDKQSVAANTEPACYHFDFGMFKGRTIEQLYTSKSQTELGYIPYLFATQSKRSTSWYMDKLKGALNQEGRWGTTQEESARVRPAVHRRWTEEKAVMDEALAQGETFHKDKVRRTNLMVQKVAQDQADDLEQGSVVPAVARRTPTPRRPHRSTAILENQHCSYCGLLGHKVPTCEKLKQDTANTTLGLLDAPGPQTLWGLIN